MVGQVIVGAQFQPAHAVAYGISRGEHEDGRAHAPRAQLLAHPPAIQTGEHDVQDDDGIIIPSRQPQPDNAVRRGIDEILSLFLQSVLHHLANGHIIFDQQ